MALTYQENKTKYYNKKSNAKKCTTDVYFCAENCDVIHSQLTYFDKLLHEAS